MFDSIRLRAIPCLLLIGLVVGLSCSSKPSAPTLDSGPSSLELTLPAYAVAGTPFDIVVAGLDAAGDLDPSANGNLTLSIANGSITPSTAALVAGEARVSVTLDGVFGSIEVTARLGERVGQATIAGVALATLPGNSTDPAAEAIPVFPYWADPAGFATDRAELEGLPLSFNQVLVSLTPSAPVSEVNAALASVGATIVGGIPATSGGHGLLALRLPAASHAQAAAMLTTLAQSAAIAVVAPDVILGETVISRPNGGAPSAWTWDPVPGTDNWGLEAIRAPAMWNANAAVEKAGVPPIRTLVVDSGFRAAHLDLAENVISVQSTAESNHGTHVAGTIGAVFNNGLGVDGVNPFARMHLLEIGALAPNAVAGLVQAGNLGGLLINAAYAAATSGADLVNMSLGYNWWKPNINIDPSVNVTAQQLVAAHGQIVGDFLNDLPASGLARPLLVVAAGNDSDSFPNQIPAQYGSPMAFAGMNGLTPDILVVAAVAQGAGAAPPIRAGFSNSPGHVSAPGVRIWSTTAVAPYDSLNGTSMAAPHVTGLLGYLLAVAPELTNTQLREIVLRDRIATVGGAADMINAYWCLLNIDWARGDDRVLRALLDIDDGSEDGNLRIDGSGAVVTGVDLDGDGGPGDGDIDMSDFRRWRDALLQLEDAPDLSLDGAADHIKKDLNGDLIAGAPADELAYPRGDFNGDGVINRFATADVVGAISGNLTDLDVFASRFSDPHYAAGELPSLIDTGDITVDARACLLAFGQADVAESSIRTVSDGQLVASRVHRLDGPLGEGVVQVYSLAPDSYEIEVNLYSNLEELVASATTENALALGADFIYEPVCISSTPILVFQLQEWNDEHVEGESIDLVAFVGISQPDGSLLPAEGATFTIGVSQGAASDAAGIVGSDGLISTSIQSFADESSPLVEVIIESALAGYAIEQLEVSSNLVDWFVHLDINDSYYWASASASIGTQLDCDSDDTFVHADENSFGFFGGGAGASAECEDATCNITVSASGSVSLSVAIEYYPDGNPKSILAVSNGDGQWDAQESDGCIGVASAGGSGAAEFYFTASAGVRTRLTGFVQHTGWEPGGGASGVYLTAGDFVYPGTIGGTTNFDESDDLTAGEHLFRVVGAASRASYSYSILYEFLPPAP